MKPNEAKCYNVWICMEITDLNNWSRKHFGILNESEAEPWKEAKYGRPKGSSRLWTDGDL